MGKLAAVPAKWGVTCSVIDAHPVMHLPAAEPSLHPTISWLSLAFILKLMEIETA